MAETPINWTEAFDKLRAWDAEKDRILQALVSSARLSRCPATCRTPFSTGRIASGLVCASSSLRLLPSPRSR